MDVSVFKVGEQVGAQRWPWASAHPGCWGQPWAGVVLAEDDARAWEGSIAFSHLLGKRAPTREEVRAHLDSVRRASRSAQVKVPVLWDFGGFTKVYWEPVTSLRPYAVDVLEWQRARAVAFEREGVRAAELAVAA